MTRPRLDDGPQGLGMSTTTTYRKDHTVENQITTKDHRSERGTSRGRKDPTTSRDGAWIKAPYREHPDGAKKYRHPVAGKIQDGEVLDVDAVLSVIVLDRLNRIPGIDIHNVCAGHGLNQGYGANWFATLGFYTDQDLGLWLIQQLGNPRGLYMRHSKQPALSFYDGQWSVHLECRVIDEHINHVAWWKLVAATLERLVRRYYREKHLGRQAGPATLTTGAAS